MSKNNITIYNYHSQPDQLIHWADINRLPWVAFSTIKQLTKTKQEIPPSLLKIISLSPEYAYRYAVFRRKPWPPGEAVIAQSPEYACAYACDVIKEAWPPGEPAIAKSGYQSYMYAKRALHGKPWPPGEPAITNPRNPKRAVQSCLYATEVIGGPWPEGEAAIASDWVQAIKYANSLKRWPWPPADQAMIKADAKGDFYVTNDVDIYMQNSIYYSVDTVELYSVQDMATGEVITTHEKPSQDAQDAGLVRIIATGKGKQSRRLPPELESIILKHNLELAIDSWYYRDFPEIIPELEKNILQNKMVYNGIMYAEKVLKEPWPELEKIILQSKDIDVLDPYAAQRIRFDNAAHAKNYAINVLKKPWPEAEPIIAAVWNYSQSYLAEFPNRYENFLRIWEENPELLELYVDCGDGEYNLKISRNEKYDMRKIQNMMSRSLIEKIKEKIKNAMRFNSGVSDFYGSEPVIALHPRIRSIYLEKFPQRKAAIEFLVNELRSRLSGVIKI